MRWMCCNIGWISKSFPRSRHETNVCKITMKQFSNTQAYVNWLDEKWRWTWSYQRSHDEKGVYVFGPVVDQHRMGNLLQDYVKDDEHLAICLAEWCFSAYAPSLCQITSSSKCQSVCFVQHVAPASKEKGRSVWFTVGPFWILLVSGVKTTPSEVWGTFLTARLVSGLAWNIANGSGNTMAQHTECFGFAIVFRQCCAALKQ